LKRIWSRISPPQEAVFSAPVRGGMDFARIQQNGALTDESLRDLSLSRRTLIHAQFLFYFYFYFYFCFYSRKVGMISLSILSWIYFKIDQIKFK
jgi:hypothetical protein